MSLGKEILHLRADVTQKKPRKMVFAGLMFYFDRVLKTVYAVYVEAAVVPPLPVQLVWKNSPLGLSRRSYVWAPK